MDIATGCASNGDLVAISSGHSPALSPGMDRKDFDFEAYYMYTGGIRQNLFEIYYFEKLHAPRARGARARARASRGGRRDESTLNNSGSKLKIRQTGPRLGNLLLFPPMGRVTCGSKYRRRFGGYNNCPI
jgi:hypothetical protein